MKIHTVPGVVTMSNSRLRKMRAKRELTDLY